MGRLCSYCPVKLLELHQEVLVWGCLYGLIKNFSGVPVVTFQVPVIAIIKPILTTI
jgi:hypothetical protein